MTTTLKPKALGLSLGIFWAFGSLFLGLLASYFNYATAWVELLGTVYIGYQPTFMGSLIGMVWGFLDAFIGGVIFAWIYNFVQGMTENQKP